MIWHQWLALGSLAICVGNLIYHFIRLLQLGKPVDLAQASGSESDGIRYSFTNGMNPRKKESAYMHLPTYAAGLMYHTGTFLSLALFVLTFLKIIPTGFWAGGCFAGYLSISVVSGFFILIKRVSLSKLRNLSNPDDYISNFLVTIFQAATVLLLLIGQKAAIQYDIIASILLIYLPLGKLKHVVYFFAARYQLGLFFGRRGVWR